ncbi:MAG: hypothetical protein GF350_07730 [Chitinivibrionales bacterium]|nr:hypothetical protein [Chitinivibrionales bacterium]
MSKNKIIFISFFLSLAVISNVLAGWHINGDESLIIAKELIQSGYRYSHPSNIFESATGRLLVGVTSGCNVEGTCRICVTYTDQSHGGWSELEIVSHSNGNDCPAFAQDDNGVIYLFYTQSCCDNTWFVKSTDDGETWSSPADCGSRDIDYSEQNNALRNPDGAWFGSSKYKRPTDGTGSGYMTIIGPDDLENQAAWDTVHTPDKMGMGMFWVVNPTERINNRYKNLFHFVRDDWIGGGKVCKSTDAGQTWTGPFGFGITSQVEGGDPNPNGDVRNACPAGVSLDIGDYYPENSGLRGFHLAAHGGDARPLSAVKSGMDCHETFGTDTDCGPNDQNPQRYFVRVWKNTGSDLTTGWEEILELRETGENADPGMIQTKDHMVHLVWTGRHVNTIRHVVLDPYKIFGVQATAAKQHPENRIKEKMLSEHKVNEYSAHYFDLRGRSIHVNHIIASGKSRTVLIESNGRINKKVLGAIN